MDADGRHRIIFTTTAEIKHGFDKIDIGYRTKVFNNLFKAFLAAYAKYGGALFVAAIDGNLEVNIVEKKV